MSNNVGFWESFWSGGSAGMDWNEGGASSQASYGYTPEPQVSEKSRPLPKGTIHQIDYSSDKKQATMHFADGRDVVRLTDRNGDLQRQIQQVGHNYAMEKDPIGTIVRDIKTNWFGICC